jgi:hypothetical protein
MAASLKHSYTVPCATPFRQAVEALAASRQVNAGDLARSVLLMLPADLIDGFPDPGEPAALDRETVLLKSGPAKGRPWRRKPRLQVRLPPGHTVPAIRRALGVALALADQRLRVSLIEADAIAAAPPAPQIDEREVLDLIERLRTVIGALSFDPLPDGIRTRNDALHVLGFPPGAKPDLRVMRAKFRLLATIHHPDSDLGSHSRMSQLNQAMQVLREE